jgi:putative ABC transport system permease protein
MSLDVGLAPRSFLPRPGIPSLRVVSLALSELARNWRGFGILVACIALGVAVIMGVGAFSDGLRSSFERQGEVLLGGDVAMSRPHRRATPEERKWMAARGRVSESATLRSMMRRLDGNDQALVEVKAVDRAYPLVGTLRLQGDVAVEGALFQGPGAIVDPILLERLGVKIGDHVQLGNSEIVIRAALAHEPDKISSRFTMGPRVFLSLGTLESSGLAAPGSLVRWRYALSLDGPTDAPSLLAFREAVRVGFPDAGFTVRDRRNPSPAVTRTLDQLRQFLTLIGLASLMIGGVGVANAVKAYVDRRRKVIAAMKSLGASGSQIFTLHLVQVMTLALIGTAIGIVLGLFLPGIVDRAIAGALPVRVTFTVSWTSIMLAAAYGLLVALLFALWPLGRAGEIRAAALFREESQPSFQWPRPTIIAATGLAAAAVAALAIFTSDRRLVAVYFLLGIVAIFIVFPLLGALIAWLARTLPRPARPELGLALGNLGAPGGLTRSVVLSLGAGLSLLSGVALVDSSIVTELQTRLPRNSPDYFLLDIPRSEMSALDRTVLRAQPEARLEEAPMLRGRLVSLAGRRVEDIKAPPEAQWVLRGDRGLSYAAEVPAGSRVVAGEWWPPNYSGEPLVSFETELAHHLKLSVGDSVTVNVLGRNISARIANLREVHWESLGINFVMVFSPNVLRGAPHNLLATITLPPSVSLAEEAQLARAIGKAHPAVTVIRVRDAVDAFNAVFEKVMMAVRAAGGVTMISGALVLAGALAAARQQRARMAVLLKAIGGTRRQILMIHLVEYLVLATVTAAVALGIGALGAWAVLTHLMRVEFTFSWSAVAQALLLSCALVVVMGMAGTARVLSARSTSYLRGE